ncbi:hypothetical protein LP419_14255 [Massilia sp. H-1]|nr:hypothetical protein LP419_14255 [Massilia sp. H-1]
MNKLLVSGESSDDTGQPSGEVRRPIGLTSTFRNAIRRATLVAHGVHEAVEHCAQQGSGIRLPECGQIHRQNEGVFVVEGLVRELLEQERAFRHRVQLSTRLRLAWFDT